MLAKEYALGDDSKAVEELRMARDKRLHESLASPDPLRDGWALEAPKRRRADRTARRVAASEFAKHAGYLAGLPIMRGRSSEASPRTNSAFAAYTLAGAVYNFD
jgi:hypothetical protein